MKDKKKRGRKKKFEDLVKTNFYIEREIEYKEIDSITFSIIARQCLSINIPKLLKVMKERMGKYDDKSEI